MEHVSPFSGMLPAAGWLMILYGGLFGAIVGVMAYSFADWKAPVALGVGG